MTAVYGDGFGRTLTREIPTEIETVRRKEVYLRTTVGGQEVTLIMRDSVTPYDPYLVLVRAAAYQVMKPGPFPAPRTPREIKDYLIRTNITI